MKTIYYCHDNQNDPQVRLQELETVGYAVHLFETAGALMRAIAHEQPDLVLMDVLLEGPNGFEVCAGLELKGRKNLPVILFAGIYTRPAFRKEAQRIGVANFLESEMPLAELLPLIEKAIHERKGAQSNSRAA